MTDLNLLASREPDPAPGELNALGFAKPPSET
eukprot:CAMPEP_0195272144 /NCGR_PEP_ID=MMETSP0706-20130129/15574_1 /TAXON_ID=33640 /ORGANISM="Asterionellopsis glacialis, Strain CCMP134" /LENGTH=31 /DNA_ID= /DNA_START= /DNA_END= /DNA_ORIENTATION=